MFNFVWSVITVSLVLVVISHWIYRWRNPKCNGILPPGSMGFPIIGESIQFFTPCSLEGIPPFFAKRMSRYGSLFKTNIVGHPVVISTDAEVNYHIFQQEGKAFQCWYTQSGLKLTGDEGLAAVKGDLHKYLKNIILSLIGPANLKDKLLPQMDQTNIHYLSTWAAQGIAINVKQSFEKMMFILGAKTLLSCSEDSALKLRLDYLCFVDGFISFPLNLPGTSFHAALKGRKRALEVISKTIKEKLLSLSLSSKEKGDSSSSSSSFLEVLCNEIESKESLMTHGIATELVFIVLFAAYETTSSAIALAFKYLNSHPHVLYKLTEEHEEIVKSRKDKEMTFSWEEYKTMTFTHMVINETVRLANIVPGIFRKVVEDVEIKGYTIPADWAVVACPPTIHLDPTKYQSPEEFNPWRWTVINETVRLANIVPGIFRKVVEDVEIKGYTIPAGWAIMACPPTIHLDPSKYQSPAEFNPWRWTGQDLHAGSKKFMAFGGGTRLCTGADFAKLQMAIFLHHLVTKYR